MESKARKKVVVVGGGFGGVSAARALSAYTDSDIDVTLISDKPHFEYKPALYRVVAGRSSLEVCILLQEIFEETRVNVTEDRINRISHADRLLVGSSGARYSFDYLVLALGSETAFFNIPGLREFSFEFTTIREAMQLKLHLHDLFRACSETDQKEKVCLLHVVIVGAGPSGVEIAGELAVFLKELAARYELDPSLVTLDLIEAASRILPALPARISMRAEHHLRHLGVNIFTNRPMRRGECEEITVRGMTMQTETVVWTAGVKPNTFYANIEGFEFDKVGRVAVDEFLRAKGFDSVFVLGDGAATKYTGMAQTAIYDGAFAARNIQHMLRKEPLERYVPKKTYYAIPVGPGWAAVDLGFMRVYGWFGWFVRRLVDLRYFLSILPFGKAVTVFQRGRNLCDVCGICGAVEDTFRKT